MRPDRTTAKRLGMLGAAVFLAGGVLLGTAVVASAGTPTLTFTPNTNVSGTQAISLTASGFTPKMKAGLSECNFTTGEPTILDVQTGQQEPVSCAAFEPITITSKGGLKTLSSGYGLATGVLGPPDSGTDSAGTDAAADAANYPCPPLAGQGSCAMVLAGTDKTTTPPTPESAQDTIDFNFLSTTTTTAAPAAHCTAAPNSVTATNATAPNNTATVTVTPATCLVAGTLVQVTATGLVPNSVGSVLECSSDTGQPTVLVLGTAIPVSCTPIAIFTTTASGGVPSGNQAFTVLVGTTGPPCGPGPCTGASATDSTGGNPTTDAAKYPCPPTSAQTSDTCVIAVGDLGGDKVAVPIKFAPGNLGTNPTPTSKTSPSTAKATPTATKAATGSLAFTGVGPGLWVMGFTGLALLLLGVTLLVLVDMPRRAVALALHRGRRTPDPT